MKVTINDLARIAGVSNATVSLALSNTQSLRVSKGVREKIRALAKQHGYRRNLAARALVEGRTYRVALCVHGYFATHSVVQEVDLYEQFVLYSRKIQTAGYGLDLVEIDDTRSLDEMRRELSKRFVDGFIFLYWPPELVTKLISSLQEKGVPAVSSGTILENEDLTWTAINEAMVFEEATKHLLSEGHEQIALMDVQSGATSTVRRNAFLRTIKNELGREADDWVFHLGRPRVEELVNATYEALDRMNGVRAFLITGNRYCHPLLHALRHRNISPGKDCRVIGFGETGEAKKATPPLSHYPVKNREQVEFGMEALLEQLRDPSGYQPRHRLMEPEFIQLET